MEFKYQVGDTTTIVRLEQDENTYKITIRDQVYEVAIDSVRVAGPGELAFTLGNKHYLAHVAVDDSKRFIAFDANVIALAKTETASRQQVRNAGDGGLIATMPGQVVKVLVTEGDTVTRGQALVILEAMKMEIRITAPHDGSVSQLLVKAGQIVERGQRLLELRGV